VSVSASVSASVSVSVSMSVSVSVCVCVSLPLGVEMQVQDLLAPYGARSQVLRATFDEAFFLFSPNFWKFRYVTRS
jgi:hypothetical protein